MKLYAISDIHIGHDANREALKALPAYPEDWLILAGDVGETEEQLHFALSELSRRFARLFWVPGNHDLWTLPGRDGRDELRGEAKYQRLVQICREHGALTPEDPYVPWPGDGGQTVIAPLFVLYDYSFRPASVPLDQVVAWAAEQHSVCADEYVLHADPYPSRAAWCAARCDYTERRLQALAPAQSVVLVNHFPLRQQFTRRLQRIPRFAPWCGTTYTEQWHTRYGASVVVYGHLHIRATDYVDGVRFEEVSLGYPRQWRQERGMQGYLREILS
ncbi:3',5'-cyclic AMP phosphodiesterase CpdA [Thermosporothrix hazakensis]|jgi:predicted phosphodiesterase|uniref:3',5'-cyclic AMP phosphodiesterase CpdA n=2 Tax=Thermosporothrix TaxID=768650 RepID=A0A326U678_THEHA|nr:metallophosphoesterase [Thermosporothrix hazakensis]PZW29476.1 3',5'-cyclic AMP phosphodiesterase CpdA [Thermosporothrix hazakensis]BBH85761.1 metallophosphoesterase [Thermosporothrix sp. COM3]GCE45809.1 metallophosphoesterase [Thermosporothrix hazakensis]